MPQAKPKETGKEPRISSVTERRTDVNVHEISCRKCGRTFYTDEQTKRSFERAVRHDLDNPFVCCSCERKTKRIPFE